MEPDLGPMPQTVDDFVIPDESLLGPCEGVQIVPSSEFVTPLSPTKRFGARIAEDSMIPPESPDMKFARDRLGTLLTSIRQGEAPWLNSTDKKTNAETNEFRRGPGRPRKAQHKDKQVVFELRGKPFGLRDGQKDSMYQLCRAWMRGKATDPVEPAQPPPPPGDTSLDLLAMREIVALPRARSPYPEPTEWPDRKQIDRFDAGVDPENMDALRGEYARHWKQVKNGFVLPHHTESLEKLLEGIRVPWRTGGERIPDGELSDTTEAFTCWKQCTTSIKKAPPRAQITELG